MSSRPSSSQPVEKIIKKKIKKTKRRIRKYKEKERNAPNRQERQEFRRKRRRKQKKLKKLQKEQDTLDHDSDDGAAAAEREMREEAERERREEAEQDAEQDAEREVNKTNHVFKIVRFTNRTEATVALTMVKVGNFYWMWENKEYDDGYYPIVRATDGSSQLQVGEYSLTIDRERTDHQTLVDLDVYVKGSGAVQREGYDETDKMSAKFSQLYMK